MQIEEMSPPSARMLAFLQFLPADAYNFVGDVSADDRVLYSIAVPGTPPATSSEYGRVMYRAGWRDQSWDKVTVTFVLPPKNGSGLEMYCVCIKTPAWGRLPGASWKTMILSAAPAGVIEYPI